MDRDLGTTNQYDTSIRLFNHGDTEVTEHLAGVYLRVLRASVVHEKSVLLFPRYLGRNEEVLNTNFR